MGNREKRKLQKLQKRQQQQQQQQNAAKSNELQELQKLMEQKGITKEDLQNLSNKEDIENEAKNRINNEILTQINNGKINEIPLYETIRREAIANIKNELKETETKLGELKESVSELEANVVEKRTALNTVNDNLINKKEELENIQTKIQEENEVLQQKEQETAAIRRKKEELQQRESNIEEQIKTWCKDKEEEIKRIREQYVNSNNENLQNKITELDTQVKRIEASNKILKDDWEYYVGEYQKEKRKTAQLEREKAQYYPSGEGDINILIQNNQRLNSEVAKYKEQMEKWPKEFDMQEAKRNAEDIVKLRSKNEELRAEIDRISREKDDSKANAISFAQLEEEKNNLLVSENFWHKQTLHFATLWDEFQKKQGSTFPRLIEIDNEETNNENRRQVLTSGNIRSLKDLSKHVYNYAAGQEFYYHQDDINAFIAGLGVSRMTILEGLSGTGKSSLPQIFAKAINMPVFKDDKKDNMIAVESSWHDRNEMLGYYNDFSKTFKAKDFTCAVYRANYYTEEPYFVVLDEMNLSQVEYYFSDFLSKIDTEGKWKISLIDDSAMNDYNTGQNIRAEEENRVPNKLKNGKLIVPENIWFIGTANKDSSTKEISDKVYDRAQVIYFKEMAPKPQGEHPAINPEPVSFESLKQWFGQCEQVNFDTTELKNYLKIFDIFYGFRIQKQMQQFVNIYCSLSQDTRESAMQKAIDYQLSTKILRKMEWMDFSSKDRKDLEAFKTWCEQNNYTKSEKKLEKIIEDVPDDGTGGNN